MLGVDEGNLEQSKLPLYIAGQGGVWQALQHESIHTMLLLHEKCRSRSFRTAFARLGCLYN